MNSHKDECGTAQLILSICTHNVRERDNNLVALGLVFVLLLFLFLLSLSAAAAAMATVITPGGTPDGSQLQAKRIPLKRNRWHTSLASQQCFPFMNLLLLSISNHMKVDDIET